VDKPAVLLVDDNEATCTLITALLRHDFVVEAVNDGNHAIEKLKSRQYAAILLDLLMPSSDGYAVLDFLSANRPDVLPRVIIVTASLSHAEMQRVAAYNVHGIVAKPFEVDALFNTVRACAGKSGTAGFAGPLLSGGMLLLLAEVLPRV
jgi:CheY-like chemotaxis protein